MFNRTAGDLSVRCLEAFDGGLVQSFVLHVYSAEDDHVRITGVSRGSAEAQEWRGGEGVLVGQGSCERTSGENEVRSVGGHVELETAC